MIPFASAIPRPSATPATNHSTNPMSDSELIMGVDIPTGQNRDRMPAVSEKQRRAMWAAAEGHSNLGIPQSVGEEFVKHDSDQTRPELGDLSDHEAAEAIRDGDLPSPSVFKDSGGNDAFWLFDMRITGTGMAWRESIGEFAHRDPELWTSDEFVQRCNGLAVIWDHPEGTLSTDEFRQRSIGNIVLPYVKGEEVWGIAKIFDADAALAMQHSYRSTSPGVTPPKGSKAISLESGAQVLDEGLPQVLDHLAVCAAGVWDKGGPPEGIRLDSVLIGKGEVVADETVEELKKKLDAEKARADKAEADRADEKHRADTAEMERDSHKTRADAAEEKENERKAEQDKKDAEKRDSRKDRHAKHDGGDKTIMDCTRCDSEEEAEKAIEKEKADKAKLDNAPEPPVDANRGTEDIKDSATVAKMQQQIDTLLAMNRPLTIDERNEVAKTFHRYDALYQMLMDTAPPHLPGESPLGYRKRCASGLRKYTKGYQNYVFHDSQQLQDFGLVEGAIFDEAMAYAKNPPAEQIVGVVREIKDSTTLPGKVITRFVGDANAVWEPFQAPMGRLLAKVRTPSHGAAAVH